MIHCVSLPVEAERHLGRRLTGRCPAEPLPRKGNGRSESLGEFEVPSVCFITDPRCLKKDCWPKRNSRQRRLNRKASWSYPGVAWFSSKHAKLKLFFTVSPYLQNSRHWSLQWQEEKNGQYAVCHVCNGGQGAGELYSRARRRDIEGYRGIENKSKIQLHGRRGSDCMSRCGL